MSKEQDYEWVSFSATLNGIPVRFAIPFEEIEIITRDHETRFDTLENIFKLEDIEAQEIY